MGVAVKHVACPKCRDEGGDTRGDNLAIYKTLGGKDSGAHCFSCGYTVPSGEYKEVEGDPEKIEQFKKEQSLKKIEQNRISPEENAELKSITGFPKEYRGIRKDTLKKFGVRFDFDAETKEPLNAYYPCTKDSELVGYKVRGMPKDFSQAPIGVFNAECDLFGQFMSKGHSTHSIIIAGGENDSMAAYQMMLDNQTRNRKTQYDPTMVVSSMVGEKSAYKQIRANYQFFSQFKRIVVALDNDSAGRRGLEEILRVLPKNKVYIMDLRHKDCHEYLENGDDEKFVSDFFKAKPYTPEGVYSSHDLYNEALKFVQQSRIPMPDFMREVNDKLCGGIVRGSIVLVAGGTSSGKGFPLWEKVVTPSGFVQVSDVKVGQQLIGSNGDPVTVVGVYPQDVQDIYKVTLKDGTSVHCDENHLWNWQNRSQRARKKPFQTTTVREMIQSLNDSRKVYLPESPVVNFNNQPVPLDPYVMGCFIGDGSFHGNLSFYNQEKDIVSKVQMCLSKMGVDLLNYSNDYSYKIRTERGQKNPIRDIIRDSGLCVMSHEKFVPDVYKYNSADVRLAVLQGLVDTDGTVRDQSANIEFSTTSAKLKDDVCFLVRSLGGTCRVTERMGKYKKEDEVVECRKNYRVFIKQPKGVNFFSSEKHASRFKQGRTFARQEVISIEKVGSEKSVCFKVDADDELFLVGNFVVTHNTTINDQMTADWIMGSDERICVLSLEATAGQYSTNLLSYASGIRFARIRDEGERVHAMLSEKAQAAAEKLYKRDGETRLWVIDDRGAELKSVQDRVEEIVKSMGVTMLIIDVTSDLLDGLSLSEAQDHMSWQKKFTKETGVTIINVVHLRKTANGAKSYSQGAMPSEDDLMGTSSLQKSASLIILIGRDKLNDDEIIRNSPRIVIPKNRGVGDTGKAGALYYIADEHRLVNFKEYFNQSFEEYLEGVEHAFKDVA